MSFICVTYGYNQYTIFNINTSTPTLIDNIKAIAFQNIEQKLKTRDIQIQKEIDGSVTEEENLKKAIKATEQELQIEEDKYQEAVRQLEAKRKKEEAEEKKRAEKQAKGKKKEEKKTQEKKKKSSKKDKEQEIDNKPILDLKEKITKMTNDLQLISTNKGIYIDKRKKLQEYLTIYKKKNKEKMGIKIDLVDIKGEPLTIYNKGDGYASEFLADRAIYELHSFNVPSTPKEEAQPKKGHKPDKKKEDKKKEDAKKKEKEHKEKENENKEDKKEEEPPVELVLEPVKIDGYCIRTIKEDEEFEEGDKKDGKDKKGKKK